MLEAVHLVTDIDELRTLYCALLAHPDILDAVDSLDLVQDIVARLRRAAQREGVDVSNESKFHEWLGWTESAALVTPRSIARGRSLN